ncbi:MAG TPA: hypothetical protein ENN43_08950 [bacterium]|nr:hypothetical protein [bacterium]
MTDVLLFGEPLPHAMRYRPITQYIDLMFSLNANKQVYAEATFRLLNLFGGFWGSFDVYGLKRFFIQGEYPIAFIVGDYQGKLTPLTLWAVEDERPFEAKVFKDRRDMNKKELYLIDNSWPLSGGKIHTIVELFDVVDLDIQVLGARLHEFHQASKPSYRTERIAGNVYNDEVQNKHDQYMIGGRVSSDFALNKIAPEIFTAKIGFNYNEIIDAKDTGDYNAPVVNNYVGSADLELAFLKNMIKLYGEAAMSWYTNNKWVINYEPGMAVVGGLELNAFNTKLKGSFRSVDWFYTAYAAQTRIYNEADNYLYITQNSTWNIGEKPPRYYIGGTEYPFTKYFNRINVSYNGIAGAGNLLGFPIYENSASPFGDATPDREGFGVELSGSYLDGMIEPLVIFESLAQLEDAGRDFLVVGGGLKLNIWQIKAYGGYKMESIAGTKNTEVAFDSSVIDAGLEYEIIRRKLTAHAGFKNNVFAGKEFWVGNGVTGGIQEFDMNVTAIGGGLEYRIAKPAVVGISFSNTIVENVRVPKNTFTVQELDVRVSINF